MNKLLSNFPIIYNISNGLLAYDSIIFEYIIKSRRTVNILINFERIINSCLVGDLELSQNDYGVRRSLNESLHDYWIVSLLPVCSLSSNLLCFALRL